MAVGDAHVFLGFLTPVLTQLSAQSHCLFFLHASAEAKIRRKESSSQPSLELKTVNHQVMGPTRSQRKRLGRKRLSSETSVYPKECQMFHYF